MYRLLWNNARVCDLSNSRHSSVSLDLSQHSCSEEEWYLQKTTLWTFCCYSLHRDCDFFYGSIPQLGFPCSITSNIFTVKESRGFLKWKFGKWKPFLMFPCREKMKSVSRQDIQQVSVWGLVVWELSLGFIINETTNQWSYINI